MTTSNELTYRQAAKLLGVPINTLYSLVSRNTIPHFRRGKRVLFLTAKLSDWVRLRAKKKPPTDACASYVNDIESVAGQVQLLVAKARTGHKNLTRLVAELDTAHQLIATLKAKLEAFEDGAAKAAQEESVSDATDAIIRAANVPRDPCKIGQDIS